jgi:hypothetical protein
MFQFTEFPIHCLLAQANLLYPVVEQVPTEETTILFSDPKFVLAIVAGVVMAFAFQLLFTNLAIALIASPDNASSDDNQKSLGDAVRGIETKVGLGLLVSVSIALFAASFLAVKLSFVGSGLLGAVTGVVIWSIFFTLLTWLGSTALGSLLGSLISTATTGVQSLLGTGAAVVGANTAKNQMVSTAEDITAAVRRELTSGFDPNDIQTSLQTTLQSSLSNLQLPKLDLSQIREQFEALLKDADLGSIADSDLLKNINRETLATLVSSRTDLSKQDAERITDQLEEAWKQVAGQKGQVDLQALVQQLKSATPEELQSGELGEQLNHLVKTASAQILPGGKLTSRALQFGTSALLSNVLKNTDLSDLDIEKISRQLQTLKHNVLQLNEQSSDQKNDPSNGRIAKAPKPFSVLRADLEDYLLFSPSWELNYETVQHEFRDVIYDAAADPAIIRQELELIDRDYLAEVLSLRTDFTTEGVQALTDHLEEIRTDVFNTVQTSELQNKTQDLRSRVENYLRSTGKAELNPDAIQQDFQTLLEDPKAGLDELGDRLSQFDRSTLEQLLSQRSDLNAQEASQIVTQLEDIREQVSSQAKVLQDRTQNQARELRQKVSDYLRQTHKEELNPEGIQRDLKTLFDDPEAGISSLQERLSQFDRDTLVQLLSQRQDLSEEQANQVLDQVESVRDTLLQAPQKLVGKAKEQYEQTTQTLSNYLRETNLEELNPEGIQRDLSTLLIDPKGGAASLQARLSQVDRETLVKLLSQRDDLTEEQVNQAIDRFQSSVRSLAKAPRRLASRVQKQAIDFETNLENYLRNTDKNELNPDGIKRDLQLLLQDPRSGLGSLGDRASQFDRETFVALLSQREDITEEEANRIADQVESTYKGIVGQIQQVQQAVQSTIDKGLGNIRDYLNGMERPELNYEGIKQDFGKLFDDPQVGLEALRDRLGQFDRNTLVAVLSARDDISEIDADRIIGQVEAARDGALHRVERIQQETQKRLEALKQQAQNQVRATRKVASGAAWWVFSSAFFSLASAAIGGALAVRNLGFFIF